MPDALEVVPNIYQVSLSRTSAFLLLEGQVTIVDAGWRGSGPGLLKSLRRLGRHPSDVSRIVITHYHGDHLGDAAYLSDKCAAHMAVHEDEVPFVQGDKPLPNPFQNRFLGYLMSSLIVARRPKPVPVDLPLGDGDLLGPMEGMRIIHSPGHTPGSISLYFPSRGLLLVGDALENRGGRLGLPSSHFTVDMAQAKESIRKLAQLEFDVLCFSHFPPIRDRAGPVLRSFSESLD